jgi:alcohol dehydrogenase
VVEVGDGVQGFAPGDRVVVPFQISCGSCDRCVAGRTASCRSVPPGSTYGFGIAGTPWGGFLSDLVHVPYADHMLVPLPAGLEPAVAASASDNIPDGYRTVSALRDRWPGAPVLVCGGAAAGSIGLYAVAQAVALGASRVVYVDADAGRRAVAAAFGAEVVDAWPESFERTFPITVDASADPRGLELALRSTATDGMCTSTGIYFPEVVDAPEFPLLLMYARNVAFLTGRPHVQELIPPVLELIDGGAIDPAVVTTRVVEWDDAPDALLESGWTKLVFRR